jgi:hypothetical protein
MSNIWTPGDKPPQQPSGGIELPKGFARRRTDEEKQQESEPAPPVESQAPQAEAPAPPPRQAQQAGRRNEFFFPPTGVQVQCPSCRTPFTAGVFSIIDLGANPELRQALLGGQVNLALCPQCGAGGSLSAPLMVHDPENEFLGVLVPSQARLSDVQAQKVIGEMSQALMRRLPNEARRGYMLQAKQYFDWETFLEKFWEFEGVSREDLHRQRDQSELISSLVRLANDETAMRMVIERKKQLVDENFFALLGQVMQAYAAQGQTENMQAIRNVRQHLMESTEAGAKVKEMESKLRSAAERIRPDMSREDVLDLLLEYWGKNEEGERIAATLLTMARSMIDYQFLMILSGRIDRTQDEEARADLMELRELIVEMTSQQNQSREALIQQSQAVLQEVLQSPDMDAALHQRIDSLDELFLSLVAANLEQAEAKGATFAVKRLRSLYDKAIAILQERMPPEMRLINQLMMAQDESAVRSLLKENRALLNQEFVGALSNLEQRFRSEGSDEVANRIKSLRGQVSLMI